MRWCADHFKGVVIYGREVVSVEPDTRDPVTQKARSFHVRCENTLVLILSVGHHISRYNLSVTGLGTAGRPSLRSDGQGLSGVGHVIRPQLRLFSLLFSSFSSLVVSSIVPYLIRSACP